MEEQMSSSHVNQYLSFYLDGEQYAVNVSVVREVLGTATITKVPSMPSYMMGVINLRGSVVPVVDLRMKFGLSPGEETLDSCMIIIETPDDESSVLIGAFVDSVREVIDISDDLIEPPPRIGKNANADFIDGMGKTGDGFLILLNTDKIFSTDEISELWENATEEEINE